MAALDMLRSAADFQQIQSQSRSRSHPLLLIRYRRNGLDRTRYGISTGKKVGSAVVRNGIRRRLRTILRAVTSEVEPGFDILLAARPAAAGVKQSELESALRQLFKGARLYRDNSNATSNALAPGSPVAPNPVTWHEVHS